MRGRTIVEQIDHDGNTYMDVDISLSAKGLFEVLKTYFPDIRKDNGMITGNFKDRPYSIRVKNITYLGIPHPVFKNGSRYPEILRISTRIPFHVE